MVETGGHAVKALRQIGKTRGGAILVVILGGDGHRANTWAGVGKLGTATVGIGPLNPQVETVAVGDFDDDRLHQNLSTADIQLGNHLLQLGHHIRLGRDDQCIGGLVGRDGQLATTYAGIAATGRGAAPLLVRFYAGADALEHLHHVLGLAIFEIEDPGIALALQVAVELAHHLYDASPRLGFTTDHHGIGALIGHYLGSQQQGSVAALGVAILVEVGHQSHHLAGGGISQLDDVHFLIARLVDPAHHFHQTIDHGGPAGDEQHVGGIVMHHVAATGVVVELTQQGGQFAHRDIAHRHHPGHHLVANARVGLIHHRDGRGLGILGAHNLEHAVIHGHNGKAIDVEHAQEELVILLFVEQVVAADVDLAAYRRLYDDGLAQVLADRVDELFDVGILEAGRILGGPGRACHHQRRRDRGKTPALPFIYHSWCYSKSLF